MVYINEQGYLERKTRAGRKNPSGKSTKRNWWMIKQGTVIIINLPSKYHGRKVRFKVEFIEDKNEKTKT